MSNISEQLAALLDKPVWTRAEQVFVRDYLEQGEPAELMDLLRERYEYDLMHNRHGDEQKVNEAYARLERRMHPEPLETAGISNAPVVIMRRYGWVAAAAVLIGVSFGTYFLIQNKKQNKSIEISVAPVKTDVAPGGNKAILTLGNGSKIILDSAANGSLAIQGNTNIIKTDSGKLAYNLSEKPTSNSTEKNSNPSVIVLNTLTTPRGGQFQLTLPDGTRVWLNAASSITYPTAFAGNERKVEITGEVYLEVIHNSKMPFHVQVGDQIIEDIGTAFNINAYPDESTVNTTLLEGSVKIISKNKSKHLIPGQQAQVAGTNIRVLNNANLDNVMAWKNGRMSLTNCSVKQIMNQISRWYDVDIQYSGTIPNKNFFAVIDRNVPLSIVLQALQDYGVNTTLNGKTLTVQ